MAFISSLTVNGNVELLSALHSFAVTTLGWTLLTSTHSGISGVSGISPGFAIRSSGISGNRLISLKFGVSLIEEARLSCFACVSLNSATGAASNPTTEHWLQTNSGNSITIFMQGDLNHIFVATGRTPTTNQPTWLYAGIVNEFDRTITQSPNQVVIINSFHVNYPTAGGGRIVESPAGTFNQLVGLGVFQNFNGIGTAEKSDPNLNDGLVYMWPAIMTADATDRVYGTPIGGFFVGNAIAHGQVLTDGGGHDFINFQSFSSAGTQRAGFAVSNGT